MQKMMVFLCLCTISTIVYAQDILHKERDAKILQLTKDAKFTDLTESPDGKWIVFVKKSINEP